MPWYNKGQYQDILTKQIIFQDNFKFLDNFEISEILGQLGPPKTVYFNEQPFTSSNFRSVTAKIKIISCKPRATTYTTIRRHMNQYFRR